MAEILGPYDPASPCLTTVCKRISKTEYENQASETTEAALADLIQYLEYNPTAYHNILRKRKREDAENGGVFSWLKVKMLSTVFGEEYVEQINPDEARAKMTALKEEMISAYDYSEDARGSARRFSRRIARKRLQSQEGQMRHDVDTCTPGILPEPHCSVAKNLEKDLLENTSDSVMLSAAVTPKLGPPMPPPPPPLPPLVFATQNVGETTKKHFSEIKNQVENTMRNGPAKTRSPCNINTRSKSKAMKENMCENQEDSLEKLLDSIKNPNVRAKLKPVNIGCTDESPYQIRQKIIKAKLDAEKDFPLFNQQLIHKFQNARSPQSPQYFSDISPSGSFNISS